MLPITQIRIIWLLAIVALLSFWHISSKPSVAAGSTSQQQQPAATASSTSRQPLPAATANCPVIAQLGIRAALVPDSVAMYSVYARVVGDFKTITRTVTGSSLELARSFACRGDICQLPVPETLADNSAVLVSVDKCQASSVNFVR